MDIVLLDVTIIVVAKKNTCPHDLAVMPDVLINKYKFRKKIREHLMGGDI